MEKIAKIRNWIGNTVDLKGKFKSLIPSEYLAYPIDTILFGCI